MLQGNGCWRRFLNGIFYRRVPSGCCEQQEKKSKDGEKRKKRKESFKNKDIKSLIEKCLKLLFKNFSCSFAGVWLLFEHINSLTVLFIAIILCCFRSSPRVVVNVFRWLKFHFKLFPTLLRPSSVLPSLAFIHCRGIINIY